VIVWHKDSLQAIARLDPVNPQKIQAMAPTVKMNDTDCVARRKSTHHDADYLVAAIGIATNEALIDLHSQPPID